MKAFFFIFLLSLVYCKTTFETIKCVVQNEKVITVFLISEPQHFFASYKKFTNFFFHFRYIFLK